MNIQQRGCSRSGCPIVHLHSPSLSERPWSSPCLVLPLTQSRRHVLLQTLRERQSIVCLWFYFSDDVTLNTFHVPFVIFTSKNDAFLQIHFSPISHKLMEGARLPACQRGCRARPLRDYPTQPHKSTWNTRMALGTLFIPDALLAPCPNPSQQGQRGEPGAAL